MNKKHALVMAIAVIFATGSIDCYAQKLYRWVDKDGNVQYGDSIPPEAIDQERTTLNTQGMTVDRVARALTAEERAAAEQQQAAEQAAAKIQDEQDKLNAVLLASYPTEADLNRAYAERFDLVEQSVESAQVGVRSQQKSLSDLLAHAADLERNGKVPGAALKASLATAHKQVVQQRTFLERREAEKIALQKEFDDTLARYRTLK